ncbi:hypothetical protein CcCBS67573_g05293 [Chytriomyces confervae]|uniref:Cytochrome P450 n=1 Tax=Chytriomyces confervae TaxID=246404 RepID=A0A507FB75_9FUNG|nr:hypothetical protein CcCBS67573_g05293 [Chytriomyces confervae]
MAATKQQKRSLLLPALAGVTAAVTILTYLYRDEAIFSRGISKQKLPRLGNHVPFFGDLFTMMARIDDLQDFYVETFEKTNNATLVIKIPFNPNNYSFNNPEILEFGPRFQEIMHDFLGDGIFNADGESWRTQRKLAANIFNVKNFKEHVDSVFTSQEVSFSRALEMHGGESKEFDLKFRNTCMHIQVNTNSLQSNDNVEIMKAFDNVQERVAVRFVNSFWGIGELISGERKVHQQELKLIRDFGHSIIQQKRMSGMVENDLLALLMRVDESLGKAPSDDDLVYYVLNFLIAGRDTTASALSWAIFMLAKNPNALDALLQEINSNAYNNGYPTFDQIKSGMPYANAVFHETLRLYPSVPLNVKLANADTTFPDGTFIPKGASVGWSPYAMGRTTEIWGADAKHFRPERWLEMEKQPSPFDYPVFHAGPRVCLGRQMAELQGVFVLIQFVRKYHFELVDEASVNYSYSLTLRMKDGLKIEDLVKEQTRLQMRYQQGIITDEEAIELAGVGVLLEKLEASAERYLSIIKEPQVSKSFSEADREWIQAVTGVNTTYRKWTDYVIDETVHPGPEFQTAFERVGKAFHQHTEAGRRIFLNLFLSDIILRPPEFNEALRIFPELEVTVVETNGPKKRKLKGKTDYTEVHVVAVEAKTSIGEQDLWQCVAEAASLYKTRVDAGKANKRVWGILSNAQQWQFVLIDDDGLLWQSGYFLLELRSYDESVLQVYRIVHYIVKCCHEACTTPASITSSVVSLDQ